MKDEYLNSYIKIILFLEKKEVPHILKFDLFNSAVTLKISANHQNLIKSASYQSQVKSKFFYFSGTRCIQPHVGIQHDLYI